MGLYSCQSFEAFRFTDILLEDEARLSLVDASEMVKVPDGASV